MQATGAVVDPFEALCLGQRAETAFRQQHPAGKDEALDEIDIGGVRLEDRVIDRDVLDRRTATRFQRARDRGEIGGPIVLADRLDHLDAGHRVVLTDDIAVIGARHRHTR